MPAPTSFHPLSTQLKLDGTCKICASGTHLFDVVDMNKFCSPSDSYRFGLSGIPVYYSKCIECGFIFTRHFDDWSSGDFFEHIYNDDYIKVDGDYKERRPRANADVVSEMLRGFEGISILDYGSGNGVFSQMMRERGFADVEDYDPFSSPERPSRKFDLVTCFEVVEHSPDPVGTMADICSLLNDRGEVMFSTGLTPPDIDVIRCSWWYVGPRNGHVSIYSNRSLERLAERFGLFFRLSERAWFTRKEPRFSSALATASMSLLAPDQPAASGWHNIERSGGRGFRWTSEPVIEWPFPENSVFPSKWTFSVPLFLPVTEEFGRRVRIKIGEKEADLAPSSRDRSKLVATISLDCPPQDRTIRLITGDLVRPSEVSTSKDTRLLGLAIYTAA